MLDRPVTPEGQGRPESRSGSRFTPARPDWPPRPNPVPEGEAPADPSDSAPVFQLPPLLPEEPDGVMAGLTFGQSWGKSVEISDFFHDQNSLNRPDATDAEKGEAARDAVRMSMAPERKAHITCFQKYQNHTDLLQYIIGEGVDPDLFPEFPDSTMA